MATARTSDVGEFTVLLDSWRLHLEAANLSPRTIRGYIDDGALFARFLADKGMPTTASGIRREHVEALIASELERTAPSSAVTRYRSLQRFFHWLSEEGEIDTIGKKAARDLDRYIRVRAAHARANLPWLRLGPKGRLTPRRLSPGDRF